MRMLGQVSLLPQSLHDDPAQRLCPETVGNAAFLRVDVAPNDTPTTPLGLAGRFLCEACLADARLAHQRHPLRMLHLKGGGTSPFFGAACAKVPEYFRRLQQLP